MEMLNNSQLIKEANDLGKKMVGDIIQRHKQAGEYTTGRTSGMLHIVSTSDGFQLVGWTYTGTYDEGRRPSGWGNGGSGTEFRDALLQWANAKGLTFKSERDAQSWAFCTMRKICKQGTLRYRDPSRRQDVLATPIREMQEALTKKTAAFYAEQIKRTLFRIDLQQK